MAESHDESDVEASLLRGTGFTTRCAWCGRYRVGDRWVAVKDVPSIKESSTTHGICEDCMAALRDAGLSE